MEINQMSQLIKLMGTGQAKLTTEILGNDSSGDTSSSFEALLKQMVNNTQNNTLNNATSSVPAVDGKDNIVNGLDSISLQSQKAEKLQQMVMQQMMKIMAAQDTSSSSVGTVEIDDSSDSLFPSTNNSNDVSKLLQTMVQQQTNANATTDGLNNSSEVNSVLSKRII